jgi:hypothetical protein
VGFLFVGLFVFFSIVKKVEMKINLILVNILLLILITGCVSVSVIPLGGASFYPTNKNVIVYYSRDKIEKDYNEIAILTAKTGDADFVSDATMLNKLLEKAWQIGADAIIYEQQAERTAAGGAFIGGMLIQDTKASFRVTAIRFKE